MFCNSFIYFICTFLAVKLILSQLYPAYIFNVKTKNPIVCVYLEPSKNCNELPSISS